MRYDYGNSIEPTNKSSGCLVHFVAILLVIIVLIVAAMVGLHGLKI